MTEIVLTPMVAKKQGYIINIGSASGSDPTPLLSLYAGTKVAAVAFFNLYRKI